MVAPRQVKRPAAWRRKIDDGRPRTTLNDASLRLARIGECRLNPQQRTGPGHPQDLVVPVCGRGHLQRVVIGSEDGDDVAAVAEDVGHGLRRWVEASIGPRGRGRGAKSALHT